MKYWFHGIIGPAIGITMKHLNRVRPKRIWDWIEFIYYPGKELFLKVKVPGTTAIYVNGHRFPASLKGK